MEVADILRIHRIGKAELLADGHMRRGIGGESLRGSRKGSYNEIYNSN